MLHGPSTRRLIVYQLASLGFYYFYWCSVSRREINQVLGRAKIPTTWLLIIPGLNYWWMWLYAEGLESVTRLRLKRSDTFLYYVLSTLGWGLVDPGLRLNATGAHEDSLGRSLVLLLLAGIVAVIFVSVWIGNTFFACVMQRRISTISGHTQP